MYVIQQQCGYDWSDDTPKYERYEDAINRYSFLRRTYPNSKFRLIKVTIEVIHAQY